MKHYGKRVHAFNCPKLQRILTLVACVDHVCLYVCIVYTLTIVYHLFLNQCS